MTAADVLETLAAGGSVGARAVLLVAHPDDEVLGASLVLQRFPRLTLVHATDGATPDAADDGARLSDERYAELEAALAALGAAPGRLDMGFPDGGLTERAAALAERLLPVLAGAEVVVTHAFDGGHPDHDACALAVQTACGRLARHAPVRLEFSIYARRGSEVLTNAFPAGSEPAPVVLVLTEGEQARKAQALRAFVSQQHVVSRFPLHAEQLRAAPRHAFDQRRPVSDVLFARGDPAREAAWRTAAAQVIS